MAYLRRSFEHAANVVCRRTAQKTKPGLIQTKGAPFLGAPWSWLCLSEPPQGWCRSDSRRTSSSVLSAPSIWWCLPSCGVERIRSTSAQLTASRAQFASGVPRSCALGAHRLRHGQRIDGIRLPPVHAQIPGIAPSDAAGSAQLATGRRQKYPARGWRQRNPGGGVAVSVGTAMDVTGCRRAGFPSHRLASTAAATIA
jgi:hypothetical protein